MEQLGGQLRTNPPMKEPNQSKEKKKPREKKEEGLQSPYGQTT